MLEQYKHHISDLLTLMSVSGMFQNGVWHTGRNDQHYCICNCPACKQHSFFISRGSRYGNCKNPECAQRFNMFTFCKDILNLERGNMIRYILRKDQGLCEMDFRDFARYVHGIDDSFKRQGYRLSYICPEDREPIKECPQCGCKFFGYYTTDKGVVSPYCLYCGKFFKEFRKRKNIKRRSSNQSSNWRDDIFKRYLGKCALCGSTEDLEAHHIIPYSVDPEQGYNLENGILLCRKHHKLAHQRVFIGNKYPSMSKAGV